jgi:hypothetical protein
VIHFHPGPHDRMNLQALARYRVAVDGKQVSLPRIMSVDHEKRQETYYY